MPIVCLFLPILLAVACYTEIRWRKIPNWLTGAGALFGLGAMAIDGGVSGALSAIVGACVGAGVFLPFCLMGTLGGGDMKLMGAVGAIVGWPLILPVLAHTCLAGGILAIIVMVWSGHIWSTLASVGKILFGGKSKQRQGLRNVPTVPYGLAIAAGSLFAIFYRFF